MAVNINVPSQVKTYANLAAFPATGALKTIYIAEDTNKTYRWTGSVYTEISASAAMTWGAIGGTLSNQTDLQSALDAKVPTSRTLTINGVTQDLSADRTFTISTGITIGSTAITSGTVGRVLFEGAGNVVQESSSLFWDATNGRLGIGTSSPATNKFLDVLFNVPSLGGTGIRIRNTNNIGYSELVFDNDTTPTGVGAFVFGYSGTSSSAGANVAYFFQRRNAPILFGTNDTNRMTIYGNGNVGIGTTTDAGFRLDVNGTARVSGDMTIATASNAILTFQSNNSSIAYTTGAFALLFNTTRVARFGNDGTIRFAQNIIVAGSTNFTINASAILEANSTTQGFLPPRMTTTQKNAIATPATGLQVYDTTLNRPCFYDGTTWITL